jgi:hypothetical protein
MLKIVQLIIFWSALCARRRLFARLRSPTQAQVKRLARTKARFWIIYQLYRHPHENNLFKAVKNGFQKTGFLMDIKWKRSKYY